MMKEARIYNGGKDSLLINGVRKAGQLPPKECTWTFFLLFVHA